MNRDFKIPPKSVTSLTDPFLLAQYFSELIGKPFTLTTKTRTNGSNICKLVASVLEGNTLTELAESGCFELVPPRGKGVPKITREFIDTLTKVELPRIICKSGTEFQQRKHC